MDVIYQIINDEEQRDYIRMNPSWYKELNRNPERYQEFLKEIETVKKNAQPSKLETIDRNINVAQMLMKMFGKK